MQFIYTTNFILGYKLAGQLCKDYAATKGPGKSARPSDHEFFRRLGPIVSKRLEKATHENGFMYVSIFFSLKIFSIYVIYLLLLALNTWKVECLFLNIRLVQTPIFEAFSYRGSNIKGFRIWHFCGYQRYWLGKSLTSIKNFIILNWCHED